MFFFDDPYQNMNRKPFVCTRNENPYIDPPLNDTVPTPPRIRVEIVYDDFSKGFTKMDNCASIFISEQGVGTVTNKRKENP